MMQSDASGMMLPFTEAHEMLLIKSWSMRCRWKRAVDLTNHLSVI